MPYERKTTTKRTNITDPGMKKLRALAMVRERIMGNSPAEIAEKFQVSKKTVERTLTYAKRAGLIVEESDRILEDMVPLARGVLIQALQDGDVTVALEVYKGTGLFGAKGKTHGVNTDDDELLRHIERLRRQAAELEATTEGELVNGFGLPEGRLLDGGQPQLEAGSPVKGSEPADDEVRVDEISAVERVAVEEGAPEDGPTDGEAVNHLAYDARLGDRAA